MILTHTPIDLLLVEDNPRDADLFREYLSPRGESEYTLSHAPSLSGAREHLNSDSFDLVMLDLDLEDSEGISTFKTLHEGYPDIPIVILTGREDEELASRALTLGAQDYLMKNELNTHWLNKAIEYAIERHKSERRYQTVFKDARDPIFIESMDDEILDANQAACELLGYEREELLSLTVQDIVAPEKLSGVGDSYVEHEAEKHRRDQFESVDLHKDGTRIPVEVSTAPITFRGQPAYLTFVRDITDRKRAEQALKESEQRFRQLAENIEAVFWMRDPETNEILYVSPTYEDIWEKSASSLLDNPEDWVETIHPDDRERIVNELTNQNDVAHDVEYRILTDADEVRWIHDMAFPVQDDRGEIYRVVGVAQDITEEKERARRYQAIFNQTYQFTGLLEPDGTFVEVNDSALEFGGVSREEVLGKKIWNTPWYQLSEETRRRTREDVQRAAEGEFVRRERELQGGDGTVMIDFSIRPITDESGEVVLLVPEGRDITELKQREQELREANQAKDRLMQEIHHRVKNNFQLASSMLGLQRRATDNEEVRQILDDVQGRIQSMVSLHRMLYQQEDVDSVQMDSYLATIVDTVRDNVQRDGSTVTIEQSLADIHLSPERALICGLILTELVMDSYEHAMPRTETGKITVRFEETGGELLLSLEDNGPGFEKDLDELTANSLGLKLVKALAVDQLGGTFSAAGTDGARFEIHIPRDG